MGTRLWKKFGPKRREGKLGLKSDTKKFYLQFMAFTEYY
jgi:hypothetical protein